MRERVFLKIAVVDDFSNERKEIISLVKDYFFNNLNKYNLHPEFCEFDNGKIFLENFKAGEYNLVLLDIYMPNLAGVAVAEKLLMLDKNCKVIFFTSSPDHMLDGYQVHAIGYVLKPALENKKALYRALDYYMDLLNLDTAGITAKTSSGDLFLPYRNIIYVESSLKTVYFYLKSSEIKAQGKFADYEEQLLKDKRFLESYRNLIVNMDYIDRPLEQDFLLKNEVKIPISRRKRSEVLEKYTKYLIEGGI